MSLHHVSIKVLNSHSHHRMLCFPAGPVPSGELQCSVNRLESSAPGDSHRHWAPTHTDRNTPDVTDQPSHRTSSGTGCRLSAELHPVNILSTESGWEVWTLKGFAIWGSAVSLMRKFDLWLCVIFYEWTQRDRPGIDTSPEINISETLDVSLVSYQQCGKATLLGSLRVRT